MPAWGWIALGAVLLSSELFIDSEFYLVFLGLAALAVGGWGLLGFEQAAWLQWLSFAALSVVLMLGLRRRLVGALGRGGEVRDRVVGELATVTEAIGPGALGRAQLRGATWTVRNVGDQALAAGEQVRTLELEGLVLLVRHQGPAAAGQGAPAASRGPAPSSG